MEAVPIVGIAERMPHDAAHMKERAELTYRDALPLAAPESMKQRGQNRLRRKGSGVEARDIGADAHRRIADASQRGRIFRHRLHHQLGARRIAQWALLAERTYRAVNQFRIRGAES